MKKTITTAAIAIMGACLTANAQHNYDNQEATYFENDHLISTALQWNPNGDNKTTRGVFSKKLVVGNFSMANGDYYSHWKKQSHLKDKTFMYTHSKSKGLFFASYGKGAEIRFQTGNTWYNKPSASLVLSNNGNVGIGTIKPDAKLTVKGKIHAEEVKLDLAVPADYVFEKYYNGTSTLKEDYTMPTIEEVAAFTKENHHLPAIPSSKEIQEKGINISKMTNLLLQKIEELTLYTIEQEKRIKKLEKQAKQ